jgi:superfamily I DNA/RNA helicase
MLADDFKAQPEEDENGDMVYDPSETRLFYVGATRAINTLRVPAWARESYIRQPTPTKETA